MHQSVENRSEAEMVAVSALLHLSGLTVENGLSMKIRQPPQHPQQQEENYQAAFVASTPHLSHPKKRVRYVFIEPIKEQQPVIPPIDCNGHTKEGENLLPVSNENSMETSSKQIKSNSGRIIKRTKRFVSQSEDDVNFPNSVQKLPTPGKKVKPTNEKNPTKSSEESKDVVQPAKKMKTETFGKVEEQNNNYINGVSSSKSNRGRGSSGSKNESSTSKLKHDIFSSDIMKLIQSDGLRHSRLFEAAYELGNCTKPDATVEFQHRAIENLSTYKTVLDAKRTHMPLDRLPKASKLMQKLRGIENRQQICSEFELKFQSKPSAEWKPFTVDANRQTNISNYKVKQTTKRPFIKFWIDEFLTRKCGKEKARSILIEILKMLPNRPEVRHDFINVYLPKVVAARRQTKKKNENGATIKNEIVDIGAALPYHL